MSTDAASLAQRLSELTQQLAVLTRTDQLGNSSIATVDGAVALGDTVTLAAEASVAIPGLQDALDIASDAVTIATGLAAQAVDAAQEASEAGLQAASDANDAADAALAAAQQADENAQAALDAAKNAGGGNIYNPNAPTTDDTDYKDGQLWFVQQANTGIVTGAYIFQKPDDNPGVWVQQTLTNDVIANLDAGKINAGFISTERIAASTITGAQIQADSLTSREIAADAITAAELDADAVLARNIKAGEVTAGKLAADSVAAENVQAGAIGADQIAANSITGDKIVANSITAQEINLDTLNGQTITGALIKSAADGQHVEMEGEVLRFYDEDGNYAGYISGESTGAESVVWIGSTTSSGAFGKQTLRGGDTIDALMGTIASSKQVINGDLYAASGTYGLYRLDTNDKLQPVLTVAGTTATANVAIVRATSGTDVSLTSTGHAFQIGADSGANLAMDANEIQARSNGAASSLYINTNGNGTVSIGGSGGTVAINGTLSNSKLPSAIASGTAAYTSSIAANAGNATLSVTFPSGRFSSAPTVTVSPSNGRLTSAPQDVTKTGFNISLTNVTTGGAPGSSSAPLYASWIAVGD